MTLCPVAIAVGCKKCPIFGICPAKTIIGDYRPEQYAKGRPRPDTAKGGVKKSRWATRNVVRSLPAPAMRK